MIRKKVLFLAANPLDTSLLALEKEFSQAQDSIVNIDFVYRGAVQAGDLQELFYKYSPNVVHFAGHGIKDGALLFEDANRKSVAISKTVLIELFKFFSNTVECVVLNACYSEEIAREISCHIDNVIGMNRSIQDDSAIAFSTAFYRALDHNDSYETAFYLGKNQIQLQGFYLDSTSEHTTPELYQKNNIDITSIDLRSQTNRPTYSDLDTPEGPIPLGSKFYIERPPVEEDCFSEILKPGALVRIKAPRKMGKSSLMNRILHHASVNGAHVVNLSFQQIDNILFRSTEDFLKWFCIIIADSLSLPGEIDDTWNRRLGSRMSCTRYFEKIILDSLRVNDLLVLGLDEVDRIFSYPDVAPDFFGMLRSWHEKGKSTSSWGKLSLIITHSREVYIPMDINQSPFNVGMSVELQMLNQSQVKELAEKHLIPLRSFGDEVISFLGGNPYLVRTAFYCIARGRMTWQQFIEVAPTEDGPYRNHLRRNLEYISTDKALFDAMKKIVFSNHPVRIGNNEGFKLHGMGLVKFVGYDTESLCDLYRIYFRERLDNIL